MKMAAIPEGAACFYARTKLSLYRLSELCPGPGARKNGLLSLKHFESEGGDGVFDVVDRNFCFIIAELHLARVEQHPDAFFVYAVQCLYRIFDFLGAGRAGKCFKLDRCVFHFHISFRIKFYLVLKILVSVISSVCTAAASWR